MTCPWSRSTGDADAVTGFSREDPIYRCIWPRISVVLGSSSPSDAGREDAPAFAMAHSGNLCTVPSCDRNAKIVETQQIDWTSDGMPKDVHSRSI